MSPDPVTSTVMLLDYRNACSTSCGERREAIAIVDGTIAIEGHRSGLTHDFMMLSTPMTASDVARRFAS